MNGNGPDLSELSFPVPQPRGSPGQKSNDNGKKGKSLPEGSVSGRVTTCEDRQLPRTRRKSELCFSVRMIACPAYYLLYHTTSHPCIPTRLEPANTMKNRLGLSSSSDDHTGLKLLNASILPFSRDVTKRSDSPGWSRHRRSKALCYRLCWLRFGSRSSGCNSFSRGRWRGS